MNFLFIDHSGVCYLYLLLHHPIYYPLIGSAHLEIKLGVVQGIAHGLFNYDKPPIFANLLTFSHD